MARDRVLGNPAHMIDSAQVDYNVGVCSQNEDHSHARRSRFPSPAAANLGLLEHEPRVFPRHRAVNARISTCCSWPFQRVWSGPPRIGLHPGIQFQVIVLDPRRVDQVRSQAPRQAERETPYLRRTSAPRNPPQSLRVLGKSRVARAAHVDPPHRDDPTCARSNCIDGLRSTIVKRTALTQTFIAWGNVPPTWSRAPMGPGDARTGERVLWGNASDRNGSNT
jgi:hypothetical protein